MRPAAVSVALLPNSCESPRPHPRPQMHMVSSYEVYASTKRTDPSRKPMPAPRLSLGAAIWGAEPSDGSTVPQDCIPGPWSDSLAAQHAGAAVFRGLFSASRSTRDWVLESAPSASLHLSADTDQPRRAWIWQLDMAVHEALLTRGSRETRITVQWDASCKEGHVAFLLIPERLHGAGEAVKQLVVTLQDESQAVNSTVAQEFMRRAAQTFPHLTTLTAPCCVLPAPDQLPHLTHLIIPRPTGSSAHITAVHASISAYLTQLTSLAYTQSVSHNDHPRWSQLISTTSQTVTSFTTYYRLTDELVALVIERLPALKRLSCSRVDLTQVIDTHIQGQGQRERQTHKSRRR